MGLMARVMLPLQEREAFIDVVLAQRVQVAFVGHLPCNMHRAGHLAGRPAGC